MGDGRPAMRSGELATSRHVRLLLFILHGARAKETRGPLGTRPIVPESWDLETVGKQVMVAFVMPQDPDTDELAKTWSVLAGLHEGSAYTGVYEVDCAKSKDLCQKVGKTVGTFVKYGQPSTNFSLLETAGPRGSVDAESLSAISKKLGPLCSLEHPAGCDLEEQREIKVLDAMKTSELEDAIAPMREKLADFFGRRRAFEEEEELTAKGVQQAQQKMKEAQKQQKALQEVGELKKKQTSNSRDTLLAELASKETSYRNAYKDRVKRRDQNVGRRRDLDDEFERLGTEAKSSNFNLKRAVLEAKRAKDAKNKASDEL